MFVENATLRCRSRDTASPRRRKPSVSPPAVAWLARY